MQSNDAIYFALLPWVCKPFLQSLLKPSNLYHYEKIKFLGGLFGLILEDSQYVINITNWLLWLQHTSSKWTFDNWPNTIRTAFTFMGFKIIDTFSPGNFLLHAACVLQHILTWTGLHTHHCSESSGFMDGEVFHEWFPTWFQTSCVQIVESVDGNVPYLQTEMLWHP